MCFISQIVVFSFKNTMKPFLFFYMSFCLNLIFLLQDIQSFKDVITIAISESFDQICGKWLPIWIWVLLAPNVELIHRYPPCSWMHMTTYGMKEFLDLKEFFSPNNPINWIFPHKCWQLVKQLISESNHTNSKTR